MLLLSADTSGKYGSIAIARGSASDSCEIIDMVALEGGTFSAQLVPQIAALLAKHRFGKQDIGAFAVVSGPGSFTGLRVGLAAIKALAEVMAKPIVTVSLLEAVAVAAQQTGSVLSTLDAGRGEIYVGQYEIDSLAKPTEQLLSRDELKVLAKGRTIVTPDQSVAEFARTANLGVLEIKRPQSDAIARLGWLKLRVADTVSPEELEANYIRRSDAEIFSKPSTC